VSSVEVGGSFFWTGVFEQVNVTGWSVETVPVADYQDTFDDNVDAGHLPIYVHGTNTGAGPYLTGIWVDPIGGSWAAVHGKTAAEYQGDWDANTGAGRFTRYTTGYDDGAGSARFAAVWRGRPDTSLTDTPDDPTNQTSASFEFDSDNPERPGCNDHRDRLGELRGPRDRQPVRGGHGHVQGGRRRSTRLEGHAGRR
jgi:Polyglycine hydrolase-like, structural repeat